MCEKKWKGQDYFIWKGEKVRENLLEMVKNEILKEKVQSSTPIHPFP